MGYYGNGFVFTEEPRWQAIASVLPATLAIRGYKHNAHSIWFLDAWEQSRHEHWPFTEEFPGVLQRETELPEATLLVLGTFEHILRALPSGETRYGLGTLKFTAQLSQILGAGCFFFAADDDLTDLAVRTHSGALTEFRVRFELGAVEYSEGQLTLVPFEDAEDPEFSASPQDLEPLSRISGLEIATPQVIEGGLPLYDSAVRLWPSGNPAQILGVGTWDPFLNVERDLDVVFERLPASPPKEPAGTVASEVTASHDRIP